MPDNSNIINRLSVQITGQAQGANNAIEGVIQNLERLGDSIEALNGNKITSFISSAAIRNISDLGSAFNSFSKGSGEAFAETIKSIADIDPTGIKGLSDAAKGLTAFRGIENLSPDGVIDFAEAITDLDVTPIQNLASAAKGLEAFRSIARLSTKGSGDNLRSAFDAISNINLTPITTLAAASSGLGKNFASLASFARMGGDGIRDTFAAINQIDLSRLYQLSSIDFSNMRDLADAARVIKRLNERIHELEKGSKKAADSQKKLESSVKRTSKTAHKSTGIFGKLLNSLKRIAMYRAIRAAIRSITEGFAEGIQNLYYWSQAWGTSFAPKMDQLATAQQYLKNGFASMFSPLIEYAIPIIDRLVDEFVDFFNFVQEGFAQLTGAATWNKARKVPVQYADALDDASKSAKELKHQLLGFDELNVLNTPTDSSRGSDKDAKDYSSMFELVETAAGNNFENLGEKLAEKVNKIFDDPERWGEAGEKLADFVSTGFDNAVSFLENVNWTNVGASIGNFIKTFTNKIATKIKDTKWGEVTDTLNTAICDFIEGMPLGDILKALTKLITSILTAVPSIFLGSLEGTLNIIATILEKIGWNGIAGKFRDWSSGIAKFRKGYEDARGIVLDAMWNQMDYGSVLPTTERGFEYDPTIDGGRSFDAAGAVLGSRASNDGMDIPIRLKTLLNNEETPIGKIVTNFQKASEKIKEFFSGLLFPVKFVVGSLVALVKTKYEEFQKWWANKKDEIKLWASDIKAKVLAKWNEFVVWWAGKKAEIKLFSTDIKSKVYEKWAAFLTWWNTLSAPIKLVAPSIINLVNAKWIEFKTWWGTKYADIQTRVLNHAQRIRDAYDEFRRMWGDKKADIIAHVTATWALLQKAWENIQQMWGNAKNLAVNIVVSIGSVLADAWSWIWKTWNNSDRTLPVNVKGKANGGYINGYASGGFPSPTVGSLFWAGEGGVPELLGTIGGRSAVAGGAEITGIRDAIYAQAENETALFRQLIAAVNAKDLTLTANSTTGRWVNKALKAYSGVTG